VGYTYGLSTTQPLTQTDLGGKFAYDGGSRIGGLSIPPANVWQVAKGYTGRRGATSSSVATGQIVSTAKCNNCHNQLGVGPTFHSGQRNDGPTCSFCHTQNRTSSGWSAGSESFIHAIHGAGKRTVPFNWHAISEEEGFYEVAFPGRPQMCEGCHFPGGYDFSGSWYTEANVQSRLIQTVATGTFNTSPTLADGGVNTASWAVSPYVTGDGVTSYGTGWAYNTGTGAITEASPLTLANSPITNACFGCHDSKTAVAHMETNGGRVYTPRPEVLATVEQCLICHGPGKTAAIKEVHYK
jgi:OmcA/MtrC family decaheme c-type cytochrome